MALISIGGTILLANQNIAYIDEDLSSSGNGSYSFYDILYISDYENPRLLSAISLDPIFNVTNKNTSNLNSVEISDFDCIILEDSLLDSPNRTKLQTFLSSGGGILIIMGSNLQSDPSLLLELNIINSDPITNIEADGIMIENTNSLSPIVKNIEWNSAPESDNLSIVNPQTGVDVLVNASFEDGSLYPAILEMQSGGKVILSTIWWIDGQNKQLTQWFYYNYFFYASMIYLMGDAPDKYADWKYSPVPHTLEQTIIGILEISLILTAVISFFKAYKKSKKKAQSEYLKEFSEKMKQYEAKQNQEKRKKEKEENREDNNEKNIIVNEWEEVGTHRQLSGFLFGFFGGFFLIIPQVILTGFVFPRFIMPYPMIAGMYDWAKNLFTALWTVFDLGTSIALAKFFAQYRIDKPEKAIRYIQIFIYWQMLTGVVQTSLVGFLGSFIFPHTYLAHMSYLFIFNSFIQFPGWFQVLVFVFQGMQRTDYGLIAGILQSAVFDLLSKYGFILLFRSIFSQLPQFGDAFGALVGYSIGQWFGEFFTFVVCVKLFKKLGFHPSTLFRIDFTKDELKEVMVYGVKYVAGAVWVPFVHMIQAYLLSIWIFNYNAEWGYYSQILMITQINSLVNLYSSGLMPGISEAHSYKCEKLLQLNLIQGFKISYYVSLFIISCLIVVLGPFIEGAMGGDWTGAIKYIPLFMARTIWEPATWLGDKTFQGTGYTKEMSISWVIEQGSRVIFLYIFMNPAVLNMQMMGLLVAWFLSLVLKVFYQWIIIRRKISRFKWYIWKIFGGSGISAIISASCLYLTSKIIYRGDIVTAILLFILSIFCFMPFYSFLTGVFGGWDENTMREFDKASNMVTLVKPLARMLYKSAYYGSRHSLFNLHNKYTIDIYEDAIKEAKDLTTKKKQLVL